MDPTPPPDVPRKGPLAWAVRILLHGVLPLAVLYAAFLGAEHLLATAPESVRKPKPRTARPAVVVRVHSATATPRIETMGLVVPAREVTVRSRVGGQVESIADRFELGGRFHTGDEMLGIETADYELAVARARTAIDQAKTTLARSRAEVHQAQAVLEQRRTALAQAEANLRLEEGNQEIARREYEMLGSAKDGADRELALRAPQLAIAEAAVAASRAGVTAADANVEAAAAAVDTAQANLDAAQVDLQNAELDLTRTTIRAPFNAWVRETFVEVGTVISTQSNLATLVGTDAYWITVTLPISDLRWIRIPTQPGEDGPRVTVRDEAAWGADRTRPGRLVRLLGDLEAEGRLARLLVEVEDPLHLDAPPSQRLPLLIGSYVSVGIDGEPIEDRIVLERTWLRHGDVVWVADEADLLRIRKVGVSWRGRDRVFLSGGLEPGDRVVVTDLGSPVDGAALKPREIEVEVAAE